MNNLPSPENTNRNGRLGGGAIAGIVVGSVVGLVGLCAIAALVWSRRGKSKKQHTVHWGGHQKAQEKGDSPGGPAGTVSKSASEAIHEMATPVTKNEPGLPTEMEVPAYVGELEGSDVYRRSQALS